MEHTNDHDILIELRANVRAMRDEFADFRKVNDEAENTYVTYKEFSPIQKLVYGCVTIILVAVFSSLVYLVIKQSPVVAASAQTTNH